MRKINRIILHCSATPEGRDVSVDEIRKWHVEGNGWDDIGYHWVVHANGVIARGRLEETPGAHTKGHNSDSIGIVYIGGTDANGAPKDTRTEAQIKAINALIQQVRSIHGEHITVHGHNEFSNKACPSFDVRTEIDGKVRASLVKSRTMWGAGAIGTGELMSAITDKIYSLGLPPELAREVVEWTQALPPELLSVAGLALVIYARVTDFLRRKR